MKQWNNEPEQTQQEKYQDGWNNGTHWHYDHHEGEATDLLCGLWCSRSPSHSCWTLRSTWNNRFTVGSLLVIVVVLSMVPLLPWWCMSNDDDSIKGCVTSVATFNSQTDYYYIMSGAGKSLGYCWNSQHPQCPPACDYMWVVSGQGDNDCGKPCDLFPTDCSRIYVEAMCKDMGCTWSYRYIIYIYKLHTVIAGLFNMEIILIIADSFVISRSIAVACC